MDLQSLLQARTQTRVFDPQEKISQRPTQDGAQTSQTAGANGPVDSAVDASGMVKLTNIRTAQLTIEEKLAGAQTNATQVKSLLVEIDITVVKVQSSETDLDDLTGAQSKINSMLQAIQTLAEDTDLPEELAMQGFDLETLGLGDGILLGSDNAAVSAQLASAQETLSESLQQIIDALDALSEQISAFAKEFGLGDAEINPNLTAEEAQASSLTISAQLTELNVSISYSETQVIQSFLV